MTRELGAQIEVLAPFVVPYPLELSHPAIEPSFLENKLLSENVLLTEVEKVHILLCRDEARAVVGALPPKSIVVLTAKKRWWRTREDCLADTLRKVLAHHVVSAGLRHPRDWKGIFMLDRWLYILIAVLFFAALWWFTRVCDGL